MEVTNKYVFSQNVIKIHTNSKVYDIVALIYS